DLEGLSEQPSADAVPADRRGPQTLRGVHRHPGRRGVRRPGSDENVGGRSQFGEGFFARVKARAPQPRARALFSPRNFAPQSTRRLKGLASRGFCRGADIPVCHYSMADRNVCPTKDVVRWLNGKRTVMRVVLAEVMGMCFGVRDALKRLDAID